MERLAWNNGWRDWYGHNGVHCIDGVGGEGGVNVWKGGMECTGDTHGIYDLLDKVAEVECMTHR